MNEIEKTKCEKEIKEIIFEILQIILNELGIIPKIKQVGKKKSRGTIFESPTNFPHVGFIQMSSYSLEKLRDISYVERSLKKLGGNTLLLIAFLDKEFKLEDIGLETDFLTLTFHSKYYEDAKQYGVLPDFDETWEILHPYFMHNLRTYWMI